jgi:hypothetical protein
MKPKHFYFLMETLTFLLIVGCSVGSTQTCDSYCLSQGGVCERVEQGRSTFNTENGSVKKKPTVFYCKFFN